MGGTQEAPDVRYVKYGQPSIKVLVTYGLVSHPDALVHTRPVATPVEVVPTF